MNLTKAVAENFGKVFLNIGQGMVLGSIVTALLSKKAQPFPVLAVAFIGGVYTILIGLWFIEGSEKKEK